MRPLIVSLNLLAFFVMIAGSAFAAPIASSNYRIIDDFNLSGGGVTVCGQTGGFCSGPTSATTNAADSLPGMGTIMGGYRTISATGVYTEATVNSIASGFYTLSSGVTGAPGGGSILWDANGAGLNEDFSSLSSFMITGYGTPIEIVLEVTDGDGRKASAIFTLPASNATVVILFASFLGDLIDWSSIDSMELSANFDGTNPPNLYIEGVAVGHLPEPMSMVLMGGGLLGLALLRASRRIRRAN